MRWEILNSRERKKLFQRLSAEYGISGGALDGVELAVRGGEVWAVTRDALSVEVNAIVESFGLKLMRGGIPTVAGIQAFFATADRTSLSAVEARDFIDGKTVPGDGKIAFHGSSPIDLAEGAGSGLIRRMSR